MEAQGTTIRHFICNFPTFLSLFRRRLIEIFFSQTNYEYWGLSRGYKPLSKTLDCYRKVSLKLLLFHLFSFHETSGRLDWLRFVSRNSFAWMRTTLLRQCSGQGASTCWRPCWSWTRQRGSLPVRSWLTHSSPAQNAATGKCVCLIQVTTWLTGLLWSIHARVNFDGIFSLITCLLSESCCKTVRKLQQIAPGSHPMEGLWGMDCFPFHCPGCLELQVAPYLPH